ncbi:MAG: DUF2244 domain-containing protein [Pseudomonadota bacterium]
MPFQQIDLNERASDYPEALSRSDTVPLYRVVLWPHRSLSRGGFVFFIGMTSFLLAIPLLGLIGTMALWGLLPFLILTISALWFFMMRSYRDGHLVEELSMWRDKVQLVRMSPKEGRKDWSANPHWVQVVSHDAPVKHYLTLLGGPREVELGAFLTPEERLELKEELELKLRFLARKST